MPVEEFGVVLKTVVATLGLCWPPTPERASLTVVSLRALGALAYEDGNRCAKVTLTLG